VRGTTFIAELKRTVYFPEVSQDVPLVILVKEGWRQGKNVGKGSGKGVGKWILRLCNRRKYL